MDFFGHQDRARRKSRLLVFYFISAVVLIVLLINLVAFSALWFSEQHPPGASLLDGYAQWLLSADALWVSLLVLAVIILGSLFTMAKLRGGGAAVAQMMGGEPADPVKYPQERVLVNVVEEMAIASGMPVPEIFVMREESGINAFAAGPTPNQAAVAVTQGALDTFSRDELQGVIGHEFSHILHGDMRLNVRLIGLLAGIQLLATIGYFMLRSMSHGRYRSSGKNGGQAIAAIFAIALALIVLGYVGLFFGRLIKAAVSRQREFLADASAVQYTRNDEGIARALNKIRHYQAGTHLENRHAEELSHMCFGPPVHAFIGGMLATHPPLEKRITALGFAKLLDDEVATATPGPTHAAGDEALSGLAAGLAGTSQASSAAVADSVGHPTPAHLDYATALMAAIPAALRDGVHNPAGARAALYVLLLAHAGSHTARGLLLIEERDPEAFSEGREQWLELGKALDTRMRLPLMDIALPQLQLLSKQEKQDLLALCHELVKLDGRVELFEYVLLTLLDHQLALKSRKRSSPINDYGKVRSEIGLVAALLLSQSGMEKEARAAALKRVMQPFGSSRGAQPSSEGSILQRLEGALAAINRLPLIMKRQVVQAFADCVLADNKVEPEEAELLRAVCVTLDCPMPPLLPQQG